MGVSRGISGFSIMLSRVFYSLNWFNISPALVPIGQTFHVNLGETGLLLSSFLVGAGIFQLPAGVISSRIGAKSTAMTGLFLMSFAVIGCAYSPDFIILVILRFVVGVGAALYFSTAIGILGELYSAKLTAMIGIYNSSYNIGAGAGVILFTPIVDIYGWRSDFLISGLAMLFVTIFTFVVLPASKRYTRIELSALKERILNRKIWIVAIGFVGLWALNYTFPEFFSTYAQSIGIQDYVAGVMGGMILMFGIVGGVISGFVRKFNVIRISIAASILIGAVVITIPFTGYYGLWAIIAFEGMFATLVISLEYAVVAKIETDKTYIALSVGLINSIQIGIGSTVPYLFGFIESYGYIYSWIFLGLLAIITLFAFLRSSVRKSLEISVA